MDSNKEIASRVGDAPELICFLLYPAQFATFERALSKAMPTLSDRAGLYERRDEALMVIVRNFLGEDK